MLLLVPTMTRFVKDVSGEERVTFFLVDSGRYRSGQRGIMRRWEGLCRAIIRDSPRSVGPVSDDGDRHRADSKTVKIYDVGGWMTDEAEIARYFLAFSSTSKYFSVAAPKQKKNGPFRAGTETLSDSLCQKSGVNIPNGVFLPKMPCTFSGFSGSGC